MRVHIAHDRVRRTHVFILSVKPVLVRGALELYSLGAIASISISCVE